MTVMCRKLLGRWRLLFGNCPACNSDAPEMYDCNICDFSKNYNNRYQNRTKAQDRKFWWNRFIYNLKK